MTVNDDIAAESKAYDEALQSMRGRTVRKASSEWLDSDDPRNPDQGRAWTLLTVEFTDGHTVRLGSYDYEGYSSGFEAAMPLRDVATQEP